MSDSLQNISPGISVLSDGGQNRMYQQSETFRSEGKIWRKQNKDPHCVGIPKSYCYVFRLIYLVSVTMQLKHSSQQQLHGDKALPHTLFLTYTGTAWVVYNSIKYCFGNYKHSNVAITWFLFFCLSEYSQLSQQHRLLNRKSLSISVAMCWRWGTCILIPRRTGNFYSWGNYIPHWTVYRYFWKAMVLKRYVLKGWIFW